MELNDTINKAKYRTNNIFLSFVSFFTNKYHIDKQLKND